MEEVDFLFDSLIDLVQKPADALSPAEASSLTNQVHLLLLNITELHHKLSENLDSKNAEAYKKKKNLQRLQRNIDALQFERLHLEHQIELAQAYHTPNLLKMVRDEASQEKNESISEDDLLRQYFGVDSWSDEKNRSLVTAKIHEEINSRGKLSEKLKRRREELTHLKKKLSEKRQLLDCTVPEQVAAIEKATVALQKAMPLPMTSTERKERLEGSHKLPPPLFTLFNQLQLYVDLNDSSNSADCERDDIHRMSVRFFHHDSSQSDQEANEDQVLLHMPVPVLGKASGKSKRITLHFYLVNEHQVVLRVSGNSSALFKDVFLQELFPGDVAVEMPHNHRRAYQWCNYMAGLYRVGLNPTLPSTRGILQQLERRIHANAVLKHIIDSFQLRKQLPDVPIMAEDTTSLDQMKISLFEQAKEDQADELEVNWICNLRHFGKTRTCSVKIDMARYPVKPPVWDMQSTSIPILVKDETVVPAATFDCALAVLEEKVNVSMLSDYSQSDDLTIFNWILALQMREILRAFLHMDEVTGPESRKRKFE